MKTVRVMFTIKFVYLIGLVLLVSPACAQTANSDCWSDPPTMNYPLNWVNPFQ